MNDSENEPLSSALAAIVPEENDSLPLSAGNRYIPQPDVRRDPVVFDEEILFLTQIDPLVVLHDTDDRSSISTTATRPIAGDSELDPVFRPASGNSSVVTVTTQPDLNTVETPPFFSPHDYDVHWDMVGRTMELSDAQTSVSDPTPIHQHHNYTSPATDPLWHDPIRSPTNAYTIGRSTGSHQRRPYYYRQGATEGYDATADNISDLGDSSSGSSSGSIRRRPRSLRLRRPTSGVPETIAEQSGGNRFQASLDAGMLRLRRWIRAHNAPTSRRRHSYERRPRTTADDMDIFATASTVAEEPSRQRAFSEPEGIQMRDLLNDPRYTSFLPEVEEEPDPNRQARIRWVRINRRFQLTITIVALIFSFLLFAILVCWVGLTSAYVVAIDKRCDVPLKLYFWLATLQLILDVFRTDIIRVVFRWEATNSVSERIPIRVIVYNIAYLMYALLVLRLGIKSVFLSHDSTCPSSAPDLFRASAVFVSLSLAAWSTIVLGYLVPFCFVATLLTWNGYTPASDAHREPRIIGPAAYSREGAPPGTIDLLRPVHMAMPDTECCICMGEFEPDDSIVATECDHIFHKRCCQEWLRQARTCPVCRCDIPSCYTPEAPVAIPALARSRPFPGRDALQQEVVDMLRTWRPNRPSNSGSTPAEVDSPGPMLAPPPDDLEVGRAGGLHGTTASL